MTPRRQRLRSLDSAGMSRAYRTRDIFNPYYTLLNQLAGGEVDATEDGCPVVQFKGQIEPAGPVLHGFVACWERIARSARIKANLPAIHHILEARRVELRHGTLALVRATFQGFKALPAPPTEKSLRDVLGLTADASLADAKAAYRRLTSLYHPDKGGDDAKMAEINRAWEQAQQELK